MAVGCRVILISLGRAGTIAEDEIEHVPYAVFFPVFKANQMDSFGHVLTLLCQRWKLELYCAFRVDGYRLCQNGPFDGSLLLNAC